MRRREFVALLGAAALTQPLTVLRAQQKPMPVVGFLSSLSQSPPLDDAFRRGLADAGYVDGRNVAIEYRWTAESYDKLPAMAADLVERGAAVIGAFGPPAVIAAKAGAPAVPIVFITGADPIKFGFVESFNRPGGNLTGVWLVTTALAQKRLELLREMVPRAATIAFLLNPQNPPSAQQARDAETAAGTLGFRLLLTSAAADTDFERAFDEIVQQKADALIVGADPLFASRQVQLVALAARHAIPAIYEWREFVEAGGLMSYGTVVRQGLYKGGIYAARILQGAKPAELPVEQLNKLELLINLKAANALGITVPQSLLARADEVIE